MLERAVALQFEPAPQNRKATLLQSTDTTLTVTVAKVQLYGEVEYWSCQCGYGH